MVRCCLRTTPGLSPAAVPRGRISKRPAEIRHGHTGPEAAPSFRLPPADATETAEVPPKRIPGGCDGAGAWTVEITAAATTSRAAGCAGGVEGPATAGGADWGTSETGVRQMGHSVRGLPLRSFVMNPTPHFWHRTFPAMFGGLLKGCPPRAKFDQNPVSQRRCRSGVSEQRMAANKLTFFPRRLNAHDQPA